MKTLSYYWVLVRLGYMQIRHDGVRGFAGVLRFLRETITGKCDGMVQWRGKRMKMQRTVCGALPNGSRVTALTDGAGPQVVVSGQGIHLLSLPLGSHEDAVRLAASVICSGSAEIYADWMDMNSASLGAQLLRVFAGR